MSENETNQPSSPCVPPASANEASSLTGPAVEQGKESSTATPPEIVFPQEHADAYRTYRQGLREGRMKAAESYDKWLLTGAGGAIAFSMTFIKDFLGKGTAIHSWLLFLSWVLLGFAMGLILWNMQDSYVCFGKSIKVLDREYKKFDEKMWDRVNAEMDKFESIGRIETFNWLSVFLFFGGMLLLACFVWANI